MNATRETRVRCVRTRERRHRARACARIATRAREHDRRSIVVARILSDTRLVLCTWKIHERTLRGRGASDGRVYAYTITRTLMKY